MLRNNRHVTSSIAVVVLLSLLPGCAPTTPKTARPEAPVPAPGPAPTAPPAVAQPAPTTPPIDMIRPRPATEPPAQVVEPPPLAPPPTTPPISPAQRGKFVVLNFDNADVETVIHAASEIVGFNYVLAPDVRGKVTVQT